MRNPQIFGIWLLVGVLSLPFVWYSTRITQRAKLVWTGLVVAWAAAAVGLTLLVISGGGVTASKLESDIRSSLSDSAATTLGAPLDEKVNVQFVSCQHATGSSWTCNVEYTVSAPAEQIDQTYTATLQVACDGSGNCSFAPFTPEPAP